MRLLLAASLLTVPACGEAQPATERECFDHYAAPAPTNETARIYRQACRDLFAPELPSLITRLEKHRLDHPETAKLTHDQLVNVLHQSYYPDLAREKVDEAARELISNEAASQREVDRVWARCLLERTRRAANTLAVKVIAGECRKESTPR